MDIVSPVTGLTPEDPLTASEEGAAEEAAEEEGVITPFFYNY